MRYRRNKTVRSRAGDFSTAQPLGDYLAVPSDQPWVSVFCVRRAFEAYYRRTRGFPRAVGEQGVPMLFISVVRTNGVFLPVGPDTIRNERGALMKASGVPERFKPHSGRHASFARRRADAPDDEASFLLSVNLSGPIYQRHYRVPVSSDVDPVPRVYPRQTVGGGVRSAGPPDGVAVRGADHEEQTQRDEQLGLSTSAGSSLP